MSASTPAIATASPPGIAVAEVTPSASTDAGGGVCVSTSIVGWPIFDRSAARREDIGLLRGPRLGRVQAALGHAALEALHASAAVHELLASGVKRSEERRARGE